MGEPHDRSRLSSALDGAEAVATTVYAVLLVVVAVAILAALGYIALHPPSSFGSQGEWFYVAGAFLLVIFWVMSQAAWLIKRRRARSPLSSPDVRIGSSPGRVSLSWGSAEAARAKEDGEAWTWNVQSAPIPAATFTLDRAQLDAARALRASGRGWEEIAREVNGEYGALSAFDQSLYQRALQLAVDGGA